MDVKNCRSCGKLFNYIGGGNFLCPACMAQLDDKFKIAKQFIRENKYAGIKEVAEAADVRPQQVEKWIREERLVFGDDSPVGLACEGCGVTIKCGRFCAACKSSLANGLNSAIKKEAPAEPIRADKTVTNRMRYF